MRVKVVRHMSKDDRLTMLWEGLSREIDQADTIGELNALERTYFHPKRGRLRELTRGAQFSAMDSDGKRARGMEVARLEETARRLLAERRHSLTADTAEVVQSGTTFDFTLPSLVGAGSVRPVIQVQSTLERIFRGMGFRVEEGFEVETEFFNFDALNMGPDHPARDTQDTFWLEGGLVLRTHTSASQVRALRQYGAPLRVIFPGRCFRREDIDASHDTSFYQCEGLMVDRDISVANLLAVMRSLLAEVFEDDVQVRLRLGYFPFVEPGFELDLACVICRGTGCAVCKHSGWVELMPCGMVHPEVLRAGRIPQPYSGFAFGLGMTRLAMMRYGVPDIRLFGSGDLRFASQFPARG